MLHGRRLDEGEGRPRQKSPKRAEGMIEKQFLNVGESITNIHDSLDKLPFLLQRLLQCV
jgi:hypothetical protein